MLLPRSTDPFHGAKVKAHLLQFGQNEIQRLEPHGHGRVYLVIVFVDEDALAHAVMREIVVKADGFLNDGVEIGFYDEDCSV